MVCVCACLYSHTYTGTCVQIHAVYNECGDSRLTSGAFLNCFQPYYSLRQDFSTESELTVKACLVQLTIILALRRLRSIQIQRQSVLHSEALKEKRKWRKWVWRNGLVAESAYWCCEPSTPFPAATSGRLMATVTPALQDLKSSSSG